MELEVSLFLLGNVPRNTRKFMASWIEVRPPLGNVLNDINEPLTYLLMTLLNVDLHLVTGCILERVGVWRVE